MTETVAVLENEQGIQEPLTMLQKWPVRKGRPYQTKFAPVTPLQSGQRVIDTMFPVAKGGTAAVPGPLDRERRWCSTLWPNGLMWMWWSILAAESAGNEMTDVLREFPEL